MHSCLFYKTRLSGRFAPIYISNFNWCWIYQNFVVDKTMKKKSRIYNSFRWNSKLDKIKKFPLCHAWPLKKHGPDRFSPFDVYLTQTYRQTPWQEKYIGRCWSLFFRLLDLFCSFLFAELLVVEMLSFKKKKNLDILNSYFSRYRCKLGITVCALRITWNYATVPKSQ